MAHTGHELGAELSNLLKLPKNVIWFELRCAIDEIVTIKCAYYPDDFPTKETEAGVELIRCLDEYELVKIKK